MPKKLLVAFVLFAQVSLAGGEGTPASGAPADGSIYITHVTVIDTRTGREARDRTVVISGDRILKVTNSEPRPPGTVTKVVDGTGKYLIPGLWDMHTHDWGYQPAYALYIANGVVGVRDMFGPPDANKFRAELAKKEVVAPHFYLSSPIIDGHPKVWPNSIEVNSPEEARRIVDQEHERGADFIKVYSRLSRESYFAIIEESNRLKIPVAGHVPIQTSAWEASSAHQKSFEHLTGIALACSKDENALTQKMRAAETSIEELYALTARASRSFNPDKCKLLFKELKKNSTWQVPTLTVNRSTAFLNDPQFTNDGRIRYFGGKMRNWLIAKDDFPKTWTPADFEVRRELFAYDQKMVGAMFRAGVPLLAGTDTGNPYCFPGFSLHDELALMVQSGVSPLGALQTATSNAAIFMGSTDKYGAVAPGKIADLVLLDADPLKDIHNSTKISEVFQSGKEFDRATLDQMLRTAEIAAQSGAGK